MTVQAKDSIWFQGERFFVLDVSDDRTLVCKKCVGLTPGMAASTACYRGCVVEFEVEDDILILKKTAYDCGMQDLPDFHELIDEDTYKVDYATAEEGTAIPFTGHLLIFQGGAFMDFFTSLIDADKAWELEFEDGLLISATDLQSFIAAGRNHREHMTMGKDGRYEDIAFFQDKVHMLDVLSKTGCVMPKGSYPNGTYVWRSDSECVLCSSRMTHKDK